MKFMNMIRKYKAPIMGVGVVSAMSVSAFAAEPVEISAVMTTAFSTMVNDMMLNIAAMLPIALPLLGLSLLVAFTIQWFKKIVKKAG